MSGIEKSLTGITGLDEITFGGLPKGRNTLVCGFAGTGKTLLGTEFIVHGATMYNEPGVFILFEETPEELTKNVASLGFDLNALCEQKKIYFDFVHVERSEIEETGEYDLEALFVRIDNAISVIGAKRVVIDTIESLFAGLANEAILRAELRRLFSWLKTKGVTTIITGERGKDTLTRYGLEEYISDCVIVLDHRVHEQVSTRRMRILKYRGSEHGTNEYPFLINHDGISIFPITSAELTYSAPTERITTGISRLDTMLGGQGFFRGSTVLVSGDSGTGKTSIACSLANSTCSRGERCLYFTFEESPDQILRDVRSISIDLEPWVKKDLLQINAIRSPQYGLEMHLARMQEAVKICNPTVVIVDPISTLLGIGDPAEVKSVITRFTDFLKNRKILGLFTHLTHNTGVTELTETEISSIMDTWIVVRHAETNAERNRVIFVLKSRGTAHSNQLREFLLTDKGIDIVNVYVGPSGALTGTARLSQEAKEKVESENRKEKIEFLKNELERQRKVTESKITVIRAELDEKEDELKKEWLNEERKEQEALEQRKQTGLKRKADENISV